MQSSHQIQHPRTVFIPKKSSFLYWYYMNLGLKAQELHWSEVHDSWKHLIITFQVKFIVEVEGRPHQCG